jgi:hypothetical protein
MDEEQFGSSPRSTPPYAAFGSFEEFIRRAGDEGIPPSIDKALLVNWEIATGNESGLLTSLRSLALIDSGDRPTDLYREIRLSPTRRRPALLRCIEVAYPGLSAEGRSIDPDRLHDYFVEERGLTGQMVDKAMRFYRRIILAVTAESGGADRAAADSANRRPRRTPAVEDEATTPRSGPSPTLVAPRLPRRSPRHPVARWELGYPVITIQVSLPSETSEDALVDLFRRIRRAWSRSKRVDGSSD